MNKQGEAKDLAFFDDFSITFWEKLMNQLRYE